MPYAIDRANRIIVYIGPDGSQRWYNPRDPAGSTLTGIPQNLKLLADAWARGDDSAEAQIGTLLAGSNQQEETGAAATADGQQRAVLPLPEDITAQANVADTGFAFENRRRQIENRQNALRAKWAAAGLGPLPVAPGAPGEGGFSAPNIPTQMNGVNLPANYVNAFNRVAQVALGAEADRRERDLDALDTQYAERVLTKDRQEKRAAVGGSSLAEMERELEENEQRLSADPNNDRHIISDQYGTYHAQNGDLVRRIRDMKRTAAQMDNEYWAAPDGPEGDAVRAQRQADIAGWTYGAGGTGWAQNQNQYAVAGGRRLKYATGGRVPRMENGGFGSAPGFGGFPLAPGAGQGNANPYPPEPSTAGGWGNSFAGAQFTQQNAAAEQRRQMEAQAKLELDGIEQEKQQTLAAMAADHERRMAELRAQIAPLEQRTARQRAGIAQDRTAAQNLINLRPLTTRGPVTQYAG